MEFKTVKCIVENGKNVDIQKHCKNLYQWLAAIDFASGI